VRAEGLVCIHGIAHTHTHTPVNFPAPPSPYPHPPLLPPTLHYRPPPITPHPFTRTSPPIPGHGISSRAVIRKGDLRFVERCSVAGHVVRILDETSAPVDPSRAVLWLGGQRFTPDARGDIIVPYSTTRGGPVPIVLSVAERPLGEEGGAGGAGEGAPTDGWFFASLATLHHKAEAYQLTVDVFVNR
jgi:hypothetical protein